MTPFPYARVEPRTRPELAPARRPLPSDAWRRWSPGPTPPTEGMTRLRAGDPGRWSELTAILAADPGPWAWVVWSAVTDASVPAFRLALEGLPPATVRAILDAHGSAPAPVALADLVAARATDRGALAFFVHHPDHPLVPWDRVTAIASRTEWSSEWAHAVTLVSARDPAGLPTGGDRPQRDTLDRLRRGPPAREAPAPIDPMTWVATVLSTLADPPDRREAFDHLAARSRATALRLLDELAGDPALAPHPDAEAALVRCGLLEPPGRPDLLAHPIRVLREHAATVRFDPETDMYPNRYDALMARLAARAPGLDRLVFEEVPPPCDDDEPTSPDQLPDAYRLRVWDGDRCWELAAGDPSDWYDVDAVVGLLDTVARDLGSPYRFFPLPEENGYAEVLIAPADALDRAVAEGLLRWAEPTPLAPVERLRRARGEPDPLAFVTRDLTDEARARFPGRELEVLLDPAGGCEVIWYREVVEVPTDPARHLSMAEAMALAPDDWRVGDTVGITLDPWWR